MADSPAFLKLSCAVQNYAWGKVGMESEVARLRSGDPGFTLDPQLPYAEVGEIIYNTALHSPPWRIQR